MSLAIDKENKIVYVYRETQHFPDIVELISKMKNQGYEINII